MGSFLWLKAFHIVFVVSWYAGLLYLPRLYVYHADTTDTPGHERFLVMERKLFMIMSIGALGTTVLGLWMLGNNPAYLQAGWMHAKLAFYVLLLIYHGYCWKLYRDFAQSKNQKSHRWFRVFNEVPALILVAVVILVVVRPF